jgi:hypothetical protein
MEDQRGLEFAGTATIMRAAGALQLTIFGLAVAAAPPPAPAQTAATSFGRLQQAVGDAMTALPDDPRVGAIYDSALAIQMASPKLIAADEPDFARSLNHDAELLERAGAASGEARDALLAAVADDLNIKRSAGAGMGAGSTFPGRVALRVVTWRNGKAVNGYVVTLSPMMWAAADPMFRLPTLSPASGNVPPGRYRISAATGGKVVASEVVRIGLDADDVTNIELPVP